MHTHTHTIARLERIHHCPTLPQPPLNGYLCTPFSSSPAQGMVQFCCDKGYTLSGVSMATCNQDTGQWEPQAPDCLRKEVIGVIWSLILNFWRIEFPQCLNSLLPRQCTTISVCLGVGDVRPFFKEQHSSSLGPQNKVPISGQVSKFQSLALSLVAKSHLAQNFCHTQLSILLTAGQVPMRLGNCHTAPRMGQSICSGSAESEDCGL